MKILLIQPPIQDFYDTDVRLQPIGLCYLKAQARNFHPDCTVLIRDYHHGHGRRTVPVPKELSYLKRYWGRADKSPFCGFSHYFHFGLGFDEIQKDIEEIRPDAIGLSSLFSPYHREALEIARRVKAWRDIPVIVGGSHVNALPESILSSPAVDYVLKGEGERGFVEFISFLKGETPRSEVAGLGYKENGGFRFNPTGENYPLDEMAYPSLEDFTPSTYLFAGKPMTFMIASRSCPHRCSFCSVHLTFGDKYRKRPVDHIFREIELRYEQGYRIVDFEDDNLTFYKAEMKELCRKLIARFPNGEMEFVAMNGISYISLDDELLDLMKRAGFTHLNLALVSSDQLVREATKRPHTVEKFLAVVDKAHSLGLQIVSYQILGLPDESLRSMIQTMAFAARLPILLGASMFYLTPNSPIAKNFPPRTPEDVFKARLTAMAVETENFTRDQIYTLFITTRILDFLKSLEVEDGCSLSGLLAGVKPVETGKPSRVDIGRQLLKRLFIERKLYFWTPRGLVLNEAFQADLFFDVLREAGWLRTQNGRRLNVSDPQYSLAVP